MRGGGGDGRGGEGRGGEEGQGREGQGEGQEEGRGRRGEEEEREEVQHSVMVTPSVTTTATVQLHCDTQCISECSLLVLTSPVSPPVCLCACEGCGP